MRMRRPRLRAEYGYEMVGTYVLVYAGPASMAVAPFVGFEFSFEELAFVALVFGATVALVILAIGKRSGAHINPAITLANVLSGSSSRGLFAPYAVSQVAGGLLAGLSLRLTLGALSPGTALGSTMLAPGLNPIEGTLLEAVGTFVLATSALTASSFVVRPLGQAALVGVTLVILIMLIAPLTGASFNPVRSLGPSIFSEYYLNQPVYWVGPMLGGGCAGVAFARIKNTRHWK